MRLVAAASRGLPAAAQRTLGTLRWLSGAARHTGSDGGLHSRPPPPPRRQQRHQRPSPQVVRAMRERSEARDPQLLQRRERLEPGQQHYYATCHPGLEEVVAAELAGPAIRASNVHPGKAGVSFTGDVAVGYRANLWLRAGIRVLLLLHETLLDARQPAAEAVYDAFRDGARWQQLLAPGQTFSVDARVWSCSNLTSSQLLAVRAKDAVCDALRDARGSKPLPPEPGRTADLPLYVTAYHDRLTIYRDMSGASLHRRGYRDAMHRASLNEAAAAGILYMSGWHELCRQEGAVLADPMCGSGTLLIEGALMAADVAPGSFRRWWSFAQWHDFDREAWAEEVEAAKARRHAPPAGVEAWGNDVHRGALDLALRDARSAGVLPMLRFHHGGCREWQLPRRPALVVSNPPWGQRLLGVGPEEEGYGSGGGRGGQQFGSRDGSSSRDGGGSRDEGGPNLEWWDDARPEPAAAAYGSSREQQQGADEALAAAWWDLSGFLKGQCPGSTAFLLSGNPEASQGLRMKAARRFPLAIGGVDCRLLQYQIRGFEQRQEAGTAAGAVAERRDGPAAEGRRGREDGRRARPAR